MSLASLNGENREASSCCWWTQKRGVKEKGFGKKRKDANSFSGGKPRQACLKCREKKSRLRGIWGEIEKLSKKRFLGFRALRGAERQGRRVFSGQEGEKTAPFPSSLGGGTFYMSKVQKKAFWYAKLIERYIGRRNLYIRGSLLCGSS